MSIVVCVCYESMSTVFIIIVLYCIVCVYVCDFVILKFQFLFKTTGMNGVAVLLYDWD